MMNNLPKALAFDLDGTLASSKNPIEKGMVLSLIKLFKYVPISIVSGASKEQFEEQFLKYFPKDYNFTNKLYIFPQNGAELMEYKNGKWIIDYKNILDKENVEEIILAINSIIKEFNLSEDLGYGPIIENRGEQITLSGLGQKAPIDLKKKWDPDQIIRKKMKIILDSKLPNNEIRIGGMTSIDITKKSINKAFAMNYFINLIKIDKKDLLYFGDAIFPGGNDEIVQNNGFNCKKVANPQDTLIALHDIILRYEKAYRQETLG